MNAQELRSDGGRPQSRRRFLHAAVGAAGLAGLAAGARAQPSGGAAKLAGKPSFRDVGWVWEGQGIDPEVPPSIYGLGQGARYFGLSRVQFLFHPNDVHALRLLEKYDEVVCDITKWGWEWNADGRPRCKPTSDPATMKSEGENVARLARQFRDRGRRAAAAGSRARKGTGTFFDRTMFRMVPRAEK